MRPKGISFGAQDKARIGEKAQCTRQSAAARPRIFETILNAVLRPAGSAVTACRLSLFQQPAKSKPSLFNSRSLSAQLSRTLTQSSR